MRTALISLVLIIGLTGCGKKKAPASPANSDGATQAAPSDDEKSNEEKSVTAPDEKEEGMQSSDPCEGGE